MKRRLRLVKLAVMVLALGGTMGESSAAQQPQRCDADCVAIVEAMFLWVSQSYEVPMVRIVVDTTRSGYEQSARPWAERARPIRDLSATILRGRAGFLLGDMESAWNCSDGRCQLIDGDVFLSFLAPIIGSSAAMRLRMTIPSPGHPGGGARTEIVRLEFEQTGSWRVVGSEVIGRS